MAHIAFISLYDRNAHGLRLMSANLKKHGHRCSIIFLKRYQTRRNHRFTLEEGEYPWMGINKRGRVFKYASDSDITARELELLDQLLRRLSPDLLGMTVNTPLRAQATRVTRFLKNRFALPVVWGGYDPTVNALDCLKLCDYACVGEGDQSILEIAERLERGLSLGDVCNLAFLDRHGPVFNPKAAIEQNIDRYPWRDNETDGKYFIEDDRLLENYPVVNDNRPGVYQAMSARGCPYRCSYCCEATLKDIYDGEKFLRRRSPADLVAELARAKRQFRLTEIAFEDEIFGMNLKWLREFSELYLRDVALPFTAYIYPCRDIDRILNLLKATGLKFCCLALESGSERINRKVFDRVYDRGLFLHTAELCQRLGIEFYTDVITYCPYEEEADLEETLNVLLAMGGGFDLCVNKLFVLPGTALARQMEREGVRLGDPAKDALFNYYCRLFWIASFGPHSARLVRYLRRVRLFRRKPWLLNPLHIEILTAPLHPAPLLRSLTRRLARIKERLSRSHPSPAPSFDSAA